MLRKCDVIIIGAGASGLMSAIESGKRGRSVIVLDHGDKAGKKLLMTGGGRCNFTNCSIEAENYISHNPHFCKSALSRFSQWDFLELVKSHAISYHERSHGQLFCNNSAKDILQMLLSECRHAGVSFRLNTKIEKITCLAERQFEMQTSHGTYHCQSLIVATGGLSIPAIGAGPFGYKIAEQFGIKIWPPSAGLVPFTLQPQDKERFSGLSGIALPAIVSNKRQSFSENILFTHRGLSGPAILQISSYWLPGEDIKINLLPEKNLISELKHAQEDHPQRKLKSVLTNYLPKRLLQAILPAEMLDKPLQTISQNQSLEIAASIQRLTIRPNGTEGYRTAEVTLGGVDCDAISSKTMESRSVPGLYFIGEVLDVSGWLGGYNLQWAWSSGWCAGQYA